MSEKGKTKHDWAKIFHLVAVHFARIGEEVLNSNINNQYKLVRHLLESEIDFKVTHDDVYNYTTVFIDTEDKKYDIDDVVIHKVEFLNNNRMQAILNDFTSIIATNFHELKHLEPICSMKKVCSKCLKLKMYKDFDTKLVCNQCVKKDEKA